VIDVAGGADNDVLQGNLQTLPSAKCQVLSGVNSEQ
jgi:hypothetical protein